jgi:prophage regulatory protein
LESISPLLARLPEVLRATGYSRTALFNRIADGTFPRPVKLSGCGRAVAFPISEVRSVVQARIAGQSDAQIQRLVEHLHSARQEAEL